MTADIAINHSSTVNQLRTPTCGSSSTSSSMVSPPCSCLHDSIWVHLCPGPLHHPGVAHWSMWYATFSIRYLVVSVLDTFYHWEKVLADMWGNERVSDPGVSGADLMCVQTLPLDEIVNMQAMIEAVYERRLAHQQEYLAQQEHTHILTNDNSYNSTGEW